MSLREQLAKCESDTRHLIGAGAANRLANWRQYQSDLDLIQFIQRTIRKPFAMANGWELHKSGLTSLESIVLSNRGLFVDDDIDIASKTLGL